MDKQARIEDTRATWRFVASRIRAHAPQLAPQALTWARLARRVLLALQPWVWRFALLPVVVTASLLVATGHALSWGLLLAEALSAICLLSAWSLLRTRQTMTQRGIPYLGLSAALLVIATLAALSLAAASPWTAPLGALALALIALDVAPARLRARLPRLLHMASARVAPSLLLGLGLALLTTLTQHASADLVIWFLGAALSAFVYVAIQARAIVGVWAAGPDGAARFPIGAIAVGLALGGILIVLAALPANAPHGTLLALAALPMALVAATGLWRSTFPPARALAARQIGAVFTLVALATAGGALASAIAAHVSATLLHALGG